MVKWELTYTAWKGGERLPMQSKSLFVPIKHLSDCSQTYSGGLYWKQTSTTQINSTNNLAEQQNWSLAHPNHHTQTFRSLPGNLVSGFTVCNLILTK
jgi:hypothetical protein